MNINSFKTISRNNIVQNFFSKRKMNSYDPVHSLFNEETAEKNRAQYFDKNGEPLNSSGESGRYIGGGKDWKKIVSVSDEVKTKLAEVVKKDFISTNGLGIPEGSRENEVINHYLSTISSDKRSSASWTLNQMAGNYAERLKAFVKENNPEWKPGDAFDSNSLDEIEFTLGGVDCKV